VIRGVPASAQLAWLPILVACADTADPPEPGGGVESFGAEIGPAVRQFDAEELLPGLLSPLGYGQACWEGVDARVRGNLSAQWLDLARVELAQGRQTEARRLVVQALGTILDAQARPGFEEPPGHCLEAPPAADPRSIDARLSELIHQGWFGPEAYAYLATDPSHTDQIIGVTPGERSIPPLPDPALGTLYLMAARSAQAREDQEAAASWARQSLDTTTGVLDRTLATRTGGHDLSPPGDLLADTYMNAELTSTAFTWGWFTVDHQLRFLLAQAIEASRLSGDPQPAPPVARLQDALDPVLQARAEDPAMGARWTSQDALGRVPS